MTQTLAQRVRQKYPGAYDDMSDQELEARIDAKYPGVYDDFPRTPKRPVGARAVLAGAQAIGETPWYAKRPRGWKGALMGAMAAPWAAPISVPAGFYGKLPSVAEVVAAIPDVAGAAGGVIGGVAGNLPGALKGAALGGAGGEALQQLAETVLYDQPPVSGPGEAAGKIAGEAAKQAILETVGAGMGRGVGKVLAPGRRAVSRPIIEAAERQGVEMPASALSTSAKVPLVEAWAAKGLGGGKAAARYESAKKMLTTLADHTVKRAGKLQDASAQGQAIVAGYNQFRKAASQLKEALFREAALPERGLIVEAKQTVELLDNIVTSKTHAGKILKGTNVADLRLYRGMRKGLSEGPVEAKHVLAAKRELQGMIGAAFNDPEKRKLLKKVSATLDEEFLAALERQDPALHARFVDANAFAMDALRKIDSAAGRSIYRAAKAGRYDQIAQGIANSRVSVDDIPRIMEVAGEEGIEAMRTAVLADLISKSKRGVTKAGEPVLTPRGLDSAMRQFGDERLAALLTPEQLAKLQDLRMLGTALEKGQKVMEGSQTAFIGQMSVIPGSLAAVAFTGNAPTALAALVGNTAFNRFISSRAGQRWLTTGFPLSQMTEAGLRQLPRGVSTGFSLMSERDRQRVR